VRIANGRSWSACVCVCRVGWACVTFVNYCPYTTKRHHHNLEGKNMTITSTDLKAMCRLTPPTGSSTYPPGCGLCRDNTKSSTRSDEGSDSPTIKVAALTHLAPKLTHQRTERGV
jgi:hypothetical protein